MDLLELLDFLPPAGKSGIHPPKFCARIAASSPEAAGSMVVPCSFSMSHSAQWSLAAASRKAAPPVRTHTLRRWTLGWASVVGLFGKSLGRVRTFIRIGGRTVRLKIQKMNIDECGAGRQIKEDKGRELGSNGYQKKREELGTVSKRPR